MSKWTNFYIVTPPSVHIEMRQFKNGELVEDWHKIDDSFYNNIISSAPWFNAWSGGSCRCYCRYTFVGYVPYKVLTVSPFEENGTRTRIRHEFRFIREV